MTRALKPQVVGSITSTSTKEKVELMLDRNSNIFFATVNGKRYEQPGFTDLHILITNILKESLKLEWIPVIHIETQDAGRPSMSALRSELSLILDRFYICAVPQTEGKDKIFKSLWVTEEDRRQATMSESYSLNSLKLPYYKQGSAFIPYNDKVWAGLLNICSSIKDAATYLDKLLQEDAPAILANGGTINVSILIANKVR